jgi:hydrogenase small subunit
MQRTSTKAVVFSRRDMLKIIGAASASLGLPLRSLHALENTSAGKAAVIWLEGQDCAGCTESVLSSVVPDLRSVLLDTICLRFHETIMAGSGSVAELALNAAIADGGYVLVVEGSFPASDARFLQVGGGALSDKLLAAAQNASAVMAIGACAAYGGIPRAGATQGEGVGSLLSRQGVSKPLVNLPGCPIHPTWFYDTLTYYLASSSFPSLDEQNRPMSHYGATVHQNCPRRKYFHSSKFLVDWNSVAQQSYCLLEKGCKGPWSHADCPSLKWNDGVNWCVGNGGPCSGCTEPKFYDRLSPLYQRNV